MTDDERLACNQLRIDAVAKVLALRADKGSGPDVQDYRCAEDIIAALNDLDTAPA